MKYSINLNFSARRKELRKSLTPQELKLWFYLKGKNLGVKFRRQHGIGPYIVDFYCKEKNLVIEIDGSQHIEAKDYDKERTDYLETLGMKVLRFWNNEIDKNIEEVLLEIKKALISKQSFRSWAPRVTNYYRIDPEF